MKFHKQIQLWNPEDKIPTGSCYATAIACVLDLELYEVPYVNLLYFNDSEITRNNINEYIKLRFHKGKKEEDLQLHEIENAQNYYIKTRQLWNDVMEIFLVSRGYYLDWIPDIDRFIKDYPDTPYFVSGKSARNVEHITIYMNGKPYHDPHPSNLFLKPEGEDNKYRYEALFPISQYNESGKYYLRLEK